MFISSLVWPICESTAHANSKTVDFGPGTLDFWSAFRFLRLSLLVLRCDVVGAEQTGMHLPPNAGVCVEHNSTIGVEEDEWGDVATPETIMLLSCCASSAEADASPSGLCEMPSASNKSSTSREIASSCSSSSGGALESAPCSRTAAFSILLASSSSFSAFTSLANLSLHSWVCFDDVPAHPLHPGVSLNRIILSKVM